MVPIYQNDLTDLNRLSLHGPAAEIVTWGGHEALNLNGLALIPELPIGDAAIEVQMGADGPAYPGIAFYAQDPLNFELAYAQPHTSEGWDALQYDPVFHGSNTESRALNWFSMTRVTPPRFKW